MFCRFCGSTHPDDSTFCPSCGKPVAATSTPAHASAAAPAPAPVPLPPNAIPPKYQAERKLLIAGIVVAIGVAVVALILYLKSSGSSDSGQSASSTQSDLPAAIANNLKRSRKAANQAAAAATVRTLVSAEVSFSMTFPKAGYASLFQLGPGAETCVPPHPDAANGCMIDFGLGCSAGASGAFCVKDSYQYAIAPVGTTTPYTDFVILATPTDHDAGETDYCATSDGVVRYRANSDSPSRSLPTVSECSAWSPL